MTLSDRFCVRTIVGIATLTLGQAWAHTCPPDVTIEKQFRKAERVFLAYVVETKLEEDLLREIEIKDPSSRPADEHVKLISAGYRIVEHFKGKKTDQPRLIEMMGIGTGYPGLTPGIYFLVVLPARKNDEDRFGPQFRYVDRCMVPVSHHRLANKEFQQHLTELRSLVQSN